MSSISNNKVVAVTEGALDYSLYTHQPELPIADEAQTLVQCGGEWDFMLELLRDVVEETTNKPLQQLRDAVAANNHKEYHQAAHFIKSAALNLWLPALGDISIRAEALGKQLEVPFSANDQRLLDSRLPLIEGIEEEIARLEAYIPELEARGGQEGAGAAEGAEAEAFDEEDNGG